MLGNYSSSGILEFWEHVKLQEAWKHHDLIHHSTTECLKQMVPVMIHGDGAEMYRDTEYFCWSWSSAFGVSSTLKDVYLSKYPKAVVAEREMLSDTAPWCFKCLNILTH